MDLFEFICGLRGANGDGPDGKVYTAPELFDLGRAHPDWYINFRSHMELIWREQTREVTQHWFEFLLASARYLSDLLGADRADHRAARHR